MEGIHAAIMATNTIQKIAINQIRYDSCLTRSLQKLVDDTPELRRFSHSRRPTPPVPAAAPIRAEATAPAAFVKQAHSAVPMMAAQVPFSKPAVSRIAPSCEDLDVEMEVLSLTESDSEWSNPSQSERKSPAADFFFQNQKQGSLSLDNQRYQPALPSPSRFDWSPAKVELSTYGPSSSSTYSTYGASSNSHGSYYCW